MITAPLPEKVLDPATSARILRALIQERWQEEFYVLALDTKHHILGSKMISRGTVDRCGVHPRDIFRFLLLAGPTSKFIVGHNHPSGDCTPSAADLDVTRQLMESARLMGIPLMDHVIISTADHNPGAFHTMRETRPDLFPC